MPYIFGLFVACNKAAEVMSSPKLFIPTGGTILGQFAQAFERKVWTQSNNNDGNCTKASSKAKADLSSIASGIPCVTAVSAWKQLMSENFPGDPPAIMPEFATHGTSAPTPTAQAGNQQGSKKFPAKSYDASRKNDVAGPSSALPTPVGSTSVLTMSAGSSSSFNIPEGSSFRFNAGKQTVFGAIKSDSSATLLAFKTGKLAMPDAAEPTPSTMPFTPNKSQPATPTAIKMTLSGPSLKLEIGKTAAPKPNGATVPSSSSDAILMTPDLEKAFNQSLLKPVGKLNLGQKPAKVEPISDSTAFLAVRLLC
jgi:hypothetical protein